jgi:hypothetical protein
MRKFREAGIILGLFCFVCVLANADAKAQTVYLNVYKGSVTEKKEVNLIYRLKYRTKEGDRQTSGTYIVTLFP